MVKMIAFLSKTIYFFADKLKQIMYNSIKERIIMINLLICDDDVKSTDSITKLIREFESKNDVEFNIEVENDSTKVSLEKNRYDIAIVDVEMPNKSGLLLAQDIRRANEDSIIIVITSHMIYLDSAMDIQAFRFLTKPVEEDRFDLNFKKAIQYYQTFFKEIFVEENGKVYKIKSVDILYIENIKHGSNVVTKTRTYRTNKKPSEWEKIIDQPNFFVRSHRSYTVNLQNIIYFDKNIISFTRGRGNEPISLPCVSQRKYQNFRKAFFDFAGQLV